MLIEIADLKKTYAAPDGSDAVHVLNGVALEVAKGDTVAIVGPSGCGKSTLLNIIGALDRADSGKVQVADQDLTTLTADALAQFRSRTVGFIFQLHHLLPQCT
ncbi:MAG TPA: ATP-binding cassette domain-containing protein, partial [Chthoniobacteraceae bacterium]|nr:ATP-binding cassette domain-containing protein [Chthoniobacteraceae bacterium]